MKIYNDLLRGISEELGMSIIAYLPTLKPKVKFLRTAYRSFAVDVDYSSRELQSAYLLTYTPHYYQIIYSICLEYLPDLAKDEEIINLGFIGGGPGSEVYGVVKYLLESHEGVRIINIYIFDKYAETWGYSHKIVKKNLIELCNINRITINFRAIAFDVTGVDAILNHRSIINSLHFVSIQNCLNEIRRAAYPKLLENISELQNALRSEAVFTIVDLTSTARQIMTEIYVHLKSQHVYSLDVTTLNANTARKVISLHYRIPKELSDNLFDSSDGLIPRKNLTYDYIILSKGNDKLAITAPAFGFKDLYKPLLSKTLNKNANIKDKVFVGIDFGTSTSTVTMVFVDINNEIRSVPVNFEQKDSEGHISTSPIIDTVISLVGRGLLVGKHAAREKINLSYGINSWFNLKDCLGDLDNHIYPKSNLLNNSTVKISNAKDAINYFIKYLKTQIDKNIKELNLSVDLVEFIASIPVSFDKIAKNNLKDCFAENNIKLDDYQFIEEPIGAVVNYLYENDVVFEGDKRIMVLDLGAGTFDVSIISLHNDLNLSSKLLSTCREGMQGGDFLNKLIFKDLGFQSDIVNVEQYLNTIEAIKLECCKSVMIDRNDDFKLGRNALSDEIIYPSNSHGISLSAKKISVLFDKYFSILKITINKALEQANVLHTDLILITGGGGKNPYFQKYVYKEFPNSEIFISDNSQEQVSRGNAIHSLLLNGFGTQLITPILTRDVYVSGKNGPILLFPVNTLLPSEEQIVYFSDLDINGNEIVLISEIYNGNALVVKLTDELMHAESIQFSIDQNYFIHFSSL